MSSFSTRSIIVGAVSVIVLPCLVAFGLLYLFPVTPIAQADLVEVHSDLTSLKIPRQWQQFPVNNGLQFGNQSRDGSSSAVLTLLDNGFFQTNLVNASVGDVKAALEYSSKLTELSSKDEANCSNKKDIITDSSYPKINNKIRELVHKRVECSTPTGKRVIQDIRVVVGEDGFMRGTTFTARVDDWRINETVYNSMLDSISQRS